MIHIKGSPRADEYVVSRISNHVIKGPDYLDCTKFGKVVAICNKKNHIIMEKAVLLFSMGDGYKFKLSFDFILFFLASFLPKKWFPQKYNMVGHNIEKVSSSSSPNGHVNIMITSQGQEFIFKQAKIIP